MVKVSVVVPIYNVETYLEQCLDSLVRQTLREIEIICVNDGSTDGSLNIIQRFADQDARIIIIDKENTGYGSSMNAGIKKASGKYIGIVESDDYADESMFEKLYLLAEEHEADIAKSNYYECNELEAIVKGYREVLSECKYCKSFHPRVETAIFDVPLCIWSAIYKKKFLNDNEIWFHETPGASFQDISFNFKTLVLAERVVATPEAFLNYRTDRGNSSVNRIDKIYCVCNEFKEIDRFLDKCDLDSDQNIQNIKMKLKIKSFFWNYRRISAVFQYSFLEKMEKEFKDDIQKGWLIPECCSEQEWKDICLVIKDKMQFFYREGQDFHDLRVQRLMDKEKAHIMYEGICAILNSYDHTVLYGAGKLAGRILNIMRGKVTFNEIAVSDRKGNPDQVEGIQVTQIRELKQNPENCVFFIAVGQKYQFDVISTLREAGYQHYYALQGDIKESIYQAEENSSAAGN